ncbi:hypothetical protein X801_00306 [Opisthorchis viverrini]|uniref:Uncharacterized protein n=1 Tax=Opisthorchis viverrini TaxID=6198 RepID=A0A1S8XAQ5_OPIVI|nr:hypothetical protein X801_00306 [Opisthorchis viverrini]
MPLLAEDSPQNHLFGILAEESIQKPVSLALKAMHVEANYNHRWHNRRPGISARGNYSSDSGPRPTSWSANSVRTKSHRQTITHSHSAHQQVTKSSLEYSNTTIKPYSSVQNSDRTTIVSDRDDYDACRKRKSISEGSSATSPDACTCTVSPFYLESSRLSEPSENSPPGPKALPTHIANRLKERFEKRFLRHYYHSSQVESALAGNRNRTEKSNKYQLVAAFLVSGGIVEAWHIYSPIPVEVGRTNDVTNGGTRNLELTQRRMRLLQRYYSSARHALTEDKTSRYDNPQPRSPSLQGTHRTKASSDRCVPKMIDNNITEEDKTNRARLSRDKNLQIAENKKPKQET